MATVYLIHLSEKIGGRAGHYIGYTALETLDQRISRHRRGNGAKLLNEANRLKIEYHVVRTWEFEEAFDARSFEKKLKRRKNASQLCPTCKANAQ